MPPRLANLLRTDDAPHDTTGVGNDLGEFLRARPPTDNRKRTTAVLFESDVVFHVNDRLRPNARVPRRSRGRDLCGRRGTVRGGVSRTDTSGGVHGGGERETQEEMPAV